MGRKLWELAAAATMLAASCGAAQAQAAPRGVIPRAKGPVVMDGKLGEWSGAFATPVNFGHADWENRAAVWRYMWDDQNLYIGLEALDTITFNASPGPAYNGDGIEFYLDVRDDKKPEWAPGTLHLHFTPASNGEIKPRIQIRGGIPAFKGMTTDGMELAATKTERGYSLEFRLPWSKFPDFKPAVGKDLGIDCELCSSDGAARVDRCWVYSGVAAVAGPAAFGHMQLVESWDPADASAYSDVLFPSFLARSTPLGEPATLFVGIAPPLQGLVRKLEVTPGTKKALPMVGVKQFGPGWSRAQACLVGFTAPDDAALTVRFLGDGGKVLGTRTIPLK